MTQQAEPPSKQTLENIGRALGRTPSGIFILTSGRGEQATGMLASFVKQVGFHPPLIMASVRQGRPIVTRLRECGAFAVNICHRQNGPLVAHFAKGFSLDRKAFDGIETTTATTGVPVIPQALAHLDCVIRSEIMAGDHILFLGEVVDGNVTSQGQPMIRVRENGFDY